MNAYDNMILSLIWGSLIIMESFHMLNGDKDTTCEPYMKTYRNLNSSATEKTGYEGFCIEAV